MPDHNHEQTCSTCCRPTGCPECRQSWPRGVPGYLDAAGFWRDGERTDTTTPAQSPEDRALAAAAADEEKARARWSAAIAERQAVEALARSGPTLFTPGGGTVDRQIPAPVAGRLRQLQEAEEQAHEAYRLAGARTVAARQLARQAGMRRTAAA